MLKWELKMQYNITKSNKITKLKAREQEAQEVLNNAANIDNVSENTINTQKETQMKEAHNNTQSINAQQKTTKTTDKKIFSLYVSESKIKELDEFLNEFGKKGESRNSFVEEAIECYLQQRKIQLRQELEDKLKRI